RVSRALDEADARGSDGRARAYEPHQATPRAAPAPPERDELVRRAGSRLFLDPVTESRRVWRPTARRTPRTEPQVPVRLPMDAAQRDERLLLALALASGDRGLATLERVPREALTHAELRDAYEWVRNRLNQDGDF